MSAPLPSSALAPGKRSRLLFTEDLQRTFGAWSVKCGACKRCGDQKVGNLSGFCLARNVVVNTWQHRLCLDFVQAPAK